MEIEKIDYLENKKSFFDEIKSIFQFLKDYHLMKNKNLIKIADKSFNVCILCKGLESRKVGLFKILSLNLKIKIYPINEKTLI